MDILSIPVRDLLPHSEPMVLLDRIESCRDHGLTAVVDIRDDALFVEAGGVPAWIGLEYMGQAIAAFAGVGARRRGEPVRIGFLVSTRRYESGVSHFAIGTSLRVAVNAVTFNITGLRVFNCSIHCGEQCLVNANLNVYMPDDAGAFIKENSQ